MGAREANRIFVMVLFLCGLGVRFIVSVVEFGNNSAPRTPVRGNTRGSPLVCPFGLHDAQAAPSAPALRC